MKLSDLKPCACCHGPLLAQNVGCWYVVRVSQAILNPRAANEVLSLNSYFGGNALGLAEAFAPGTGRAVIIMGDEKDGGGWTELHFCFDCYVRRLGNLGASVEKADREQPE